MAVLWCTTATFITGTQLGMADTGRTATTATAQPTTAPMVLPPLITVTDQVARTTRAVPLRLHMAVL
jgi:hypothetical protein